MKLIQDEDALTNNAMPYLEDQAREGLRHGVGKGGAIAKFWWSKPGRTAYVRLRERRVHQYYFDTDGQREPERERE